MRSKIRFSRWLGGRLPSDEDRRLVVLTGARQTGKTTLVRDRYPDLTYLTFDDIELREQVSGIRTSSWGRSVGAAILDEAQKAPSVFEKVKFAYDAEEIDFSVLTGSSRILLLDNVRETLAGRAFVYELWPLMPSELRSEGGRELKQPLIDRIIGGDTNISDRLADEPEILLGEEDAGLRESFEHIVSWGGMPELARLDHEDRKQWLTSYRATFLERDLADLVRLTDLEPFCTLQKLCMLRTGCLLTLSKLARDAHISPATTRRYLEYLRVSFQVILLPPYAKNLTSRVVKSPKVYWIDLGLLRSGTRRWGEVDGALFETFVVGEVWKWVATMGREVDLFFYRTHSGFEVDLLLETTSGVIGAEIKHRDRPAPSDLRGLRKLAEALGTRWRGGLLVHRGDALRCLDAEYRIWGVPAHRLF